MILWFSNNKLDKMLSEIAKLAFKWLFAAIFYAKESYDLYAKKLNNSKIKSYEMIYTFLN